MSILIKGMNMPKGCDECTCNSGIYCNAMPIAFCGYTEDEDRPEWCPLVEVPPHGRLIDADALKEEGADIHMDYVCDGYVEDTTWGYSDDLLDSQPTIIEAEE